VETQKLGDMGTAEIELAPRKSVTYAKSAAFPLWNPKLYTTFFFRFTLEASFLNQKQIDAAAVMLRIFLSGLALNFDADYHELEEITKRALLEVESEAAH